MNAYAGDERDLLLYHSERNFPVPSLVNANNLDLDRYTFITNNSQERDPATSSTSPMSPHDAPLTSSHFPFSPALNPFQKSPQILQTGSRLIFQGPQLPRPDDFSSSAPITGFGQHSPHGLQYMDQTLQYTSPRDPFDLETSPYGRHENGHAASTVMLTEILTNFRPQPGFGNYVTDWRASPATSPMYSRPTSSGLKATSTHTRTRTTPRHQHHQHQDSLLRSKCPTDRLHSLNVAIQSRDEPVIDEPISNDLLEPAGDEKSLCFCYSRARETKAITPARDPRGHVRESLGNLPSRGSNSRCRHSPAFDPSPKNQFDPEVYDTATHSNPDDTEYASGAGSCVRGWSTSSVTPSMYSLPTSHLNATSTRIRTRTTQRNQRHQYMDSLLRAKCPRSRSHALNVAIQFRDEYGADEAIPNDLLDELLESTGDGKYIFCCQRAQKARNITGARDLVRRSLGNFPFRCSNLGCEHSSLRRADLNKHTKICKFPALTLAPNGSQGIQNLGSSAQGLSESTSSTPQQQNTVSDPGPLLNITSSKDGMDTYLVFPFFGDESEARIHGFE